MRRGTHCTLCGALKHFQNLMVMKVTTIYGREETDYRCKINCVKPEKKKKEKLLVKAAGSIIYRSK